MNAGEVVGLLGPNGAGKTTDAVDSRDADRTRCRRSANCRDRFAAAANVCGASSALFRSRSRSIRRLAHFKTLEIFARVHGLTRRLAEARSIESLEAVGLRDRADDPGLDALGRYEATAQSRLRHGSSPRALLLDEPTVGVDPQSREGIFTTIRTAADSGVAVLYSTHYMEEVERMCDRALLIDRGKVDRPRHGRPIDRAGRPPSAHGNHLRKSHHDPDGTTVCRG